MNKELNKYSTHPCERVIQYFALLALTMFLTTGTAVAVPETKGAVSATLTLKKVVVESGKETLVNAPKIKPGDLLEYTTTYRNGSKESIMDLNASLPIPVGLEYVNNTAKPVVGVLATIDNAKFEPLPLKRKVTDKNGKTSEVEVPLTEYRGLRWTIGKLDAGNKIQVSARMRVIELAKSPEELVKKPGAVSPITVLPAAKSKR